MFNLELKRKTLLLDNLFSSKMSDSLFLFSFLSLCQSETSGISPFFLENFFISSLEQVSEKWENDYPESFLSLELGLYSPLALRFSTLISFSSIVS
jgi:hypothetical protein